MLYVKRSVEHEAIFPKSGGKNVDGRMSITKVLGLKLFHTLRGSVLRLKICKIPNYDYISWIHFIFKQKNNTQKKDVEQDNLCELISVFYIVKLQFRLRYFTL